MFLRAPQWDVHIFVSSTFDDTHAERNLLLQGVYPGLRAEAWTLGVDLCVSDMRWGVKDENTDDHLTWVQCHREIERCMHASCGLFFLSLQSER